MCSYSWDAENRLIRLVQADTPSATDVNVDAAPVAVVFTPDSTKAYVANQGSGTVSVLDCTSTTPTLVDTITLSTSICAAIASPDGKTVYIRDISHVYFIDTATNALFATVTTGYGDAQGKSLAISPDGGRLYVCNNSSLTLSVIDTVNKSLITDIPDVGTAAVLAISTDAKKVYLTDTSGTIYVIDTATNTVLTTISAGSNILDIAISPDGTKLYAVNRNGTASKVFVIDTSTNIVSAAISGAFAESFSIALTPDGSQLYVAQDNGSLVSISTSSNTVNATISLGAGTNTNKVLITPDGLKALVISWGSNAVSVIDTTSNTVTNTFSTGSGPVLLAISRDSNKALICNAGDSKVTFLNLNPGTASNSTNSQFTYDPLDRCVKIVDTNLGGTPNIQQFIWSGAARCESRDSGGNTVTAQFYPWGEKVGVTKYLFERDHRGDIVGVTDSSGTEITAISYDPYGTPSFTYLSGSFTPDFGFTGLYYHQPSKLNIATFRSYDSSLGRWLSRDPIAEAGGTNLYTYAANNPINFFDPLGLAVYVAYQKWNYPNNVFGVPVVHSGVIITDDKTGKITDDFNWGPPEDSRHSTHGPLIEYDPEEEETVGHTFDDQTYYNYGRREVIKPDGMSQQDFENAIRESAQRFRDDMNTANAQWTAKGKGENVNCHESSTAIVQGAGGTMPKPPMGIGLRLFSGFGLFYNPYAGYGGKPSLP